MQSHTRRTLSMAASALDFAAAHPATDASYNALVAKLKEVVTRGEELSRQFQGGVASEHASRAQRQQVKETMERVQLRHLMGVAEVAAADHPEIAKLFVPPPFGGPQRDLVDAAKVMLEKVQPFKELFTSIGLGDTFLADLQAAVDAFDAATDTVHTGRRDHVGASGELPRVAKQCRKLVRLLDGLFQIRFKDDGEALAAWKSSSNVAGPFTRSKQAPAVAPGADRAPSPSSASASSNAPEQLEAPKQLPPAGEA